MHAKTKALNVLVVDVGGNHVKVLVTGKPVHRKFTSGPTLTAQQMVDGVKQLAGDWKYDVVSIGYPAPVIHGKPAEEPVHLGGGWMDLDYQEAFGCQVKIINDAAMQAVGSYEGGKMLFLGLGTGLGSAMIVEGMVVPLELGHLPYRKGSYEDYVGRGGLARLGRKKWRKRVVEVVELLRSGFLPDYIVLGGGNVDQLDGLPPDCRRGDNSNAFTGGFRLWNQGEKSSPFTDRSLSL